MACSLLAQKGILWEVVKDTASRGVLLGTVRRNGQERRKELCHCAWVLVTIMAGATSKHGTQVAVRTDEKSASLDDLVDHVLFSGLPALNWVRRL